MIVTFYKYNGTGNDFIIIDSRIDKINLSAQQINFLCNRHIGIGADGLMCIENDNESNFKMIYYNADGKESTLCGNGSRCIVKFFFDTLLENKKTLNKCTFKTVDGIHNAKKEDDIITISINDIKAGIDVYNKVDFIINTGSPHYISFQKNIDHFNLIDYAKPIRYSEYFKKQNGINVNIIEALAPNTIKIRTYERGVEGETLSCGTGVTAAALVFAFSKNLKDKQKIKVLAKGGSLEVDFIKRENSFNHIFLKGQAIKVFNGNIDI